MHFSDVHHNYYSAWKYVTKKDEHVLESENHPDLWNSKASKTSTASARKKKCRKREQQQESTVTELVEQQESTVTELVSSCDESEGINTAEDEVLKEKGSQPVQKRKKKGLSAFELSEIIVEKGFKQEQNF